MFHKSRLLVTSLVLSSTLILFALPVLSQVPPPVDVGWPRGYTTPSGGEIIVYAPQVSSWDNQKLLVAFSAVSYLPSGAKESALGTIKIEAETQVSIEERLVNLANLTFTEVNFQTLSKEQSRELISELVATFPDTARIMSLDRILASLDKSQIMPKNLEGVKADPPPIYFSKRSAVLVVFDGEPIWSPIKDNNLELAVNTNWDFFQHTTTKTFYIRIEGAWLKAPELKGPWTPAGDLPPSFDKLPDDDNWLDVKANLPGKKLSTKDAPTVFVTTEPAELILLDGEPKYVPVAGTQLQWVSNCESDVFRLGKTGEVYFLVSGRWFSGPDFTGPWTFATPNLPEDFKDIPLEHERSQVLASVPGSDEAAEAILLAQIPQTARVSKAELKAPEVTYQGEPEFKPIEGVACQQAVNTDKDIIKVGDLFYMCFQGVWFMSTTPSGPWEVTGDVPGEIYEIPPSSECHHVTYVVVQDYHPTDAYVSFAYTSGYTGVVIAWGVPVYGTGWYYPPYVYWGYPYPVYYPRWVTYGCGVRYNPWTGRYVNSGGIYGPYGGARFGSSYNPRTGTFARGTVAYGPHGARGAAQMWNPRTNTYASTRQGADAYGSWGSTYVQRGDNWAQTKRYTDASTSRTRRVTTSNKGTVVSGSGDRGRGFVASGGDNIYAGHDGNVYKRDDNGDWQKHDDGGWSDISKPERPDESNRPKLTAREQSKQSPSAADKAKDSRATQPGKSGNIQDGKSPAGDTKPVSSIVGQLERDQSSRAKGSQRAGEYNRQRSQGSRGSTSSRSLGGSGGRRR